MGPRSIGTKVGNSLELNGAGPWVSESQEGIEDRKRVLTWIIQI